MRPGFDYGRYTRLAHALRRAALARLLARALGILAALAARGRTR